MTAEALIAAWRSLEPPARPDAWTGARIGPCARVARNRADGAAVLMRREAPTEGQQPADVGLRTHHIEYRPQVVLTVQEANGEEADHGCFAVLQCDGSDPELVAQFLRIAGSLPYDAENAGVFDVEVKKLFELFRGLSRQGLSTPQGIWAETLLVAHASNPAYLVAAWHSDPKELHDFVGDGDHLEVKSSSRSLREHDFSLEQLQHRPECTIVVSLLLTRRDEGATVFDLLTTVQSRLPTAELKRRAETIVTQALGDAWRESQDLRFDVEAALASIALYSALEIPRVPDPISPSVSHVRFRADLSATPQVQPGTHTLAQALPD